MTTIAQWARQTGRLADTVTRKIILDIDASLVKRSPVDTGRFKGNWQMGINNKPSGTLDVFDGTGSTTLALHASQVNGSTIGNKYYMVNNLDYAQALEDGYSQRQAPQGMVELTRIEFQSTVDAIANAL